MQAESRRDLEFKLTWSPLDGVDHRILGILETSAVPGESARVVFHARELQLRELFASLSVDEAKVVHRRLALRRMIPSLLDSRG